MPNASNTIKSTAHERQTIFVITAVKITVPVNNRISDTTDAIRKKRDSVII